MPHGTTDSLLEVGETYDPAEMHAAMVAMPKAIDRLIQAISPRSSSIAYGTTVTVPPDVVPFNILPADRARVRAIIKIPANAGAGVTVAIGGNSDVSSGGGFVLYPGDQLEIKTVAAIFCLVTAGGVAVNISRWVELED